MQVIPSSGVLQGTKDRYGGMNVPAKSLPDNDHDFAKALHSAFFFLKDSL
jgi:hypothetical protein